MPAKKTVKQLKKKALKEEAKKPITKTVAKKTLAKTAPRTREATPKTVASTVRPKTNDNAFSFMNIAAIIFVIAIILLVAFMANRAKKTNTNQPAAPTVQSISYDCPEGKTALDILKEKNTVTSQDTSVGVYVDSINGFQNNEGSFWMYYINGQAGSVGPDQYKCQAGDTVEWRYEKLI
jgi:hypothetical protein